MDAQSLVRLYRWMLTARLLDEAEQRLTQRGEAFFHVGGAGHESSAALAEHLIPADWLHCHYRQRALLLARGITAESFFGTIFCKNNSSSRGRQMPGFFSDRRLNVITMSVPTANNALQSVGVATTLKHDARRPIVMCGIGDGGTQQGEFLEAIADAVRDQLPVMFFIEDNGWAISTETRGKTFWSLPGGKATEFLGLPIDYVDGRRASTASEQLGQIVKRMRETRGPAIVVFRVERLQSHTNADDQTVYRSADSIRTAQSTGDPLKILADELRASGVSDERLETMRREITAELEAAELAAASGPEPLSTVTAKVPAPVELTHPARERAGTDDGQRLTMREALRDVLLAQLTTNPRVRLLGEDIEDPKGDVFGVTRGLSRQFPGRVVNSPLSETTILGKSIGQALAGERPVAFIQFADFLPVAFNQIFSELSSIAWRSDHEWQAPVILMVACGAYRPGLGPFHAQTFESTLAHVPGIDVVMPATAGDAAGLLNAAFQSQRPTVFLYPKSMLNDSQLTTSSDVDEQFVPLGVARKCRTGRDVTLVGWGNTVRLCERVADALTQAGVEAEVLDLRSISPWDQQSVLASAEKTARLIVVHEDNHTCGLGAEILATVAEKTRVPVTMRRVTRPDTFVSCNFANQLELLPSFKRVLTTAAELLNLDLSWVAPPPEESGLHVVEAIGSAPSDETLVVADVHVKLGDTVTRGTSLASLEASKSVFELTSPESGLVEKVHAAAGETVRVGAPLFAIRGLADNRRVKPVTKETSGKPVLRRLHAPSALVVRHRENRPRAFDVGVSRAVAVTGGRTVTNAELLGRSKGMTSEDIIKRTGIEERHWAAPGETAVNMAGRACRQLLDREGLLLDDLDLVICSTTSPTVVTPSMACQVLNELAQGRHETLLQAYDISAACSGYLYALQAGYDFLQSRPDGRVMIVTAEVLSPLLDLDDFDTAILFGDATSAAVLYGESHFDKARARLIRPELAAKGEDGSTLSVPFRHGGHIHMRGQKVFSEAVRAMVSSLTRLCEHQGLRVKDLQMVVPHQANQRIIDAVQSRIETTVYSNIRFNGNTSSSSIPLCLADVLETSVSGDRLGLCAFGGGFTFGAGILEII